MNPEPLVPPPPSGQNRQARDGRRVLVILAIVSIVLIIAGILLVRYWKKEQTVALPQPSGDELQVHILNIGQGDSILIIAPGGKSVLVDAGTPGSGQAVLDAMKRYNVKQIDLMIATHAHADHIGGADEVLHATKVSTVLDSRVPHTTKNYEDFLAAVNQSGAKYIAASPGQTFDLGGNAQLTVLAPIQPFFTKNQLRSGANEPNANSVVARLDYGDFSMLLTGDAEAETEERLMKTNANIKTKVLKVGHHGSRYASSEKFLRQGGFEAAIISDGAENRYGHPSQEALNRFRQMGMKLYRTDLEGEITIVSRGSGYEIRTERTATGDLWAGRTPPKDDAAREQSDLGETGQSSRQSRRAGSGR
ncbi:MAG: competence protein ComEC [Acidobacteriota bacterium]|jgi:beta-lactamase superfamily II metal-dependent hydrolase|nr:competence protein ComEC [Acidobacteriota bacterium]